MSNIPPPPPKKKLFKYKDEVISSLPVVHATSEVLFGSLKPKTYKKEEVCLYKDRL